MNSSTQPRIRPLGVPRAPRRRFVPPAAVRIAQVCLLARILFAVVLVALAGSATVPTAVAIPGVGRFVLPGASTWSAAALWVVAAAVFEGALVLRLGRLRAGSRRVILLVEGLVIAASGMYTAAGLKIALVPLVSAIAAIALLRLDHVRHSFNRARSERRVLLQEIPTTLFDGYALPEPAAVKEIQRIGYRVGVDSERARSGASEMSRA
ncbi:MAG: hypothetical protein M3Z57_06310 [Candidatus Dormibacteraeota bacterium]|nr:hypothetical protein [Candidatus Dormibacteraeota bacterium]